MNAKFEVVADHSMGALRVTMGGFFTPDDVMSFLREVNLKLDALHTRPNEHLMLCDARGMRIQAQDIVGAFAEIVGSPRLRSKRLAFVNGSSLSRLQTRRLTDRDGVSFFADLAEAEQWLFSEPTGALARADGESLPRS